MPRQHTTASGFRDGKLAGWDLVWFFLRVSTLSQWMALAELDLVLLAVAGVLFVFIATLISQNFGSRTIWPTLLVFVTIASASCIYKLSGLRHGLSLTSAAGVLEYAATFASFLGLPLAVGALVLERLYREKPQKKVGLQMTIAWAACVGAMPIGFASTILVGRVANLIRAI